MLEQGHRYLSKKISILLLIFVRTESIIIVDCILYKYVHTVDFTVTDPPFIVTRSDSSEA